MTELCPLPFCGDGEPTAPWNCTTSITPSGIRAAPSTPLTPTKPSIVSMDEALACGDLEESYQLWQQAQWNGSTGVTQEGDIPWVWLVNIDHLYWVRDGLQVAQQKIHPHGHGWSVVKQCGPVELGWREQGEGEPSMKDNVLFGVKKLLRAALLLLGVSLGAFLLLCASPLDPLQTNVGQVALGSMTPEQ